MQNAELRKNRFSILNSAFSILHSSHLFPLALIALLALTLFIAPLLKQEVFTLRDHLDYFQPLRFFTAEELKAGRLPFWNPYSASGEPWLANPQTGVFYPPTWAFLVLPFPAAYMLFLLFHLVLLGWGAYLFFARRASPGAAMVGAVALMFSGPVLSLLDVNNTLATFAWIPLVLWCAAERAPVRGGFALALAFLGGEPFFAGVAAVMFVIVSFVEVRHSFLSRQARAPVFHIAIAALVALGLTAVQLFPFLELLAGSDRTGGMSSESILRHSMPLRDWLHVAWPAFDAKLGQQFIPIVYMGALVVALALLGVRKAGWLILLAIVVAVAAGPSLLAALPLTIFRYPSRVVPLASLAVVALATAGWDRIRNGKRWADLLVVLIVAADLVAHARPLLGSAPFRRDLVPYPRAIGADAKILRVEESFRANRAVWIAGYLNLYDRRFDANTPAPVANERYLRFVRTLLERPTASALNALPAGYVLTSLALPSPLERVGRAANVIVYRNPHARPMAALLTKNGLVAAKWEMTTSRARMIVDAPESGVLVLAQQDAPGWRVTVDGKTSEKQLIFGLFRGVEVSRGRHEVLWTYRPRFFFAGLAVTIVTLIATTIFFFVKRSR